jgi:lysophospholipase L1-like esterase
MRRLLIAMLIVGAGFLAPAVGQTDRWESAIRAFEEKDRAAPPAPGGNVFVGSSSIRLWKLDESFPGAACINRGFGGSEMADSARFVERIVTPHKPRVVVVYAGDNDLAAGKTPEKVRDDYKQFVSKVRPKLPDAKIVCIGVKPSLQRWALADKFRATNKLLVEAQKGDDKQVFIDVWPAMLGADGKPRPELFVSDGLHMTAEGYKIWAGLVKPHLATQGAKNAP